MLKKQIEDELELSKIKLVPKDFVLTDGTIVHTMEVVEGENLIKLLDLVAGMDDDNEYD